MTQDIEKLKPELDAFIRMAMQEDVKDGDHSSLASIPAAKQGKARLLVKDDGILAGVELARYIFASQAPEIHFYQQMSDGQAVHKGDIAFTIEGPIRDILKLERLVLNCMQRMSGIATRTYQMMERLQGTNTRVLDTRKNTPGIRFLEKWAVRIGGGVNHRFGLYDMIVLKDNHVDGAGGIAQAITATHDYLDKNKLDLKVEIETRNLDEVQQVLDTGGVDRIMLDNFDIPTLQKAVDMIGGRYEIEVSGGITLDNIREYALAGVDYVSSSQMTHSVKSLDLSLKLVKE